MMKKILLTLSVFHDELPPWLMKTLRNLAVETQLKESVASLSGAVL